MPFRLLASAVGAALFAAATVHAHAVVQKASLDEQAVRPGVATRVTLRFNSGIEPGFTKVTLVEDGGKERALPVEPEGPAAVHVDLPALDAGAYGLRYKVLAVDGHVTESVLRFTVAPAP